MESRVRDLKSWRCLHIGWMLLACVIIEIPLMLALSGDGTLLQRLAGEADNSAHLVLLLLGFGALLLLSLWVGLNIFARNYIAFRNAGDLLDTENRLHHREA